MAIEKDILISLLKLTQSGPVSKDVIARHARIPVQTTEQALNRLCREGLFNEYEGGLIEASPSQRARIALYALRFTADFQRVCGLLSWKEFESIAAEAFETNDYQVLSNFRFKQASKRWEIDIVGLKKPFILCVDCKHWKRGWRQAATAKAVEAQIKRTEAFAKALPDYQEKMKIAAWKTATLIPIVMSLVPGPYKFYNDVPVVPVLQLQDFINELPGEAHLLKHLDQKTLKRHRDLKEIC